MPRWKGPLVSALCCGKWAAGWGKERGIYQVASREGTAGAPQLGLAEPPSSQVSAFVANTPFVFMHVHGSMAPEAKILHHSTSMSKSCKATHHLVASWESGSWSSTACPALSPLWSEIESPVWTGSDSAATWPQSFTESHCPSKHSPNALVSNSLQVKC